MSKQNVHPILRDLPEYLKDPKNYEWVQKQLFEKIATTHDHEEVQEWAKCVHCQSKVRDHAQEMRRLGFKDGKQYMVWRKIMEIMRNKIRDPYDWTNTNLRGTE